MFYKYVYFSLTGQFKSQINLYYLSFIVSKTIKKKSNLLSHDSTIKITYVNVYTFIAVVLRNAGYVGGTKMKNSLIPETAELSRKEMCKNKHANKQNKGLWGNISVTLFIS